MLGYHRELSVARGVPRRIYVGGAASDVAFSLLAMLTHFPQTRPASKRGPMTEHEDTHDRYVLGVLSMVGAEVLTADRMPCQATKDGKHRWIDNGSDCEACGAHRAAHS